MKLSLVINEAIKIYKRQKKDISYIQRCVSTFLFINRIFLYSILFSLLYFTVIYTFLVYFTWSRCSLVRSKNNTLDETRDREQPAYAERFALSLLLVFRFLFFLSTRYFEAFSFQRTRLDNRKGVDITHACVAHDWGTSLEEKSRCWRQLFFFFLFIYIRNRAPRIIAVVRGICVCMQMDLRSRARHLFRASKRLCREICAAPLQSAFSSGKLPLQRNICEGK